MSTDKTFDSLFKEHLDEIYDEMTLVKDKFYPEGAKWEDLDADHKNWFNDIAGNIRRNIVEELNHDHDH